MIEWFKGIGLFVSDMFRHWVGIMTGFLSIILAIAPVMFPDFFGGNKGILHSRWTWEAAAVISFFLASYSAWREKHKALLQARALVDQKKPRIALRATKDAWFIWYLKGDPAEYIQVEPLVSQSGSSRVTFRPIEFVSDKEQFRRLECEYFIGEKSYGCDMGNIVRVFFRHVNEEGYVDNRLVIRYRWGKEFLEETTILRWSRNQSAFTTMPPQ